MRSDVRFMYLYLLTRKDAYWKDPCNINLSLRADTVRKYWYDGASGVSSHIRRYLVDNNK